MIVFDCLTSGGNTPPPALPGFSRDMVMVDWHNRVPSDATLDLTARQHAGKLVCLEIKALPVDAWHADGWGDPGAFVDGLQARANRATLAKLAKDLHRRSPGMRLGYFNLLPLERYAAIEHPERPDPDRLQAWRRQNDAAAEDLGPAVDLLFPQRYAYDADFNRWAGQSDMVLEEAARLGRACIPVIGPMLLDSGAMMGPDQMRLQLEYCAARRDIEAVALYGPRQEDQPWFTAACQWAQP